MSVDRRLDRVAENSTRRDHERRNYGRRNLSSCEERLAGECRQIADDDDQHRMTSACILDHLQSVQQLTSDTDKQTVAVIQSAADESVHKFCWRLQRQRLLDRSQLSQLEKANECECSDMISHGELTITQNAKVVNDTWELRKRKFMGKA